MINCDKSLFLSMINITLFLLEQKNKIQLIEVCVSHPFLFVINPNYCIINMEKCHKNMQMYNSKLHRVGGFKSVCCFVECVKNYFQNFLLSSRCSSEIKTFLYTVCK